MSKNITFLQKWYKSQCNGIWEKDHGIIIRTVDNPGWRVTVDLRNTELEFKKFEMLEVERTEEDWYHCFIRDYKFEEASSPQYLGFILSQFCKWVDNSYTEEDDELINRFQQWYHSHCDGYWEHNKNISIKSLPNRCWSIFINVEETELEDEKFKLLKIKRTEEDWLRCAVEGKKFKARCGIFNLAEVLNVFLDWVNDYKNRKFVFLQKWHQNHCNGLWEQDHGIVIETLENSSWQVTIDLKGTEYIDTPFEKQEEYLGDKDWYSCLVKKQKFQGTGSAQYLGFILNVFCNWVESSYEEEYDQLVNHFQQWYQDHFNDEWEYNKNIVIKSLSNKEWRVFINLKGTELEEKTFELPKQERAEDDWYRCCIQDSRFDGYGGPRNLADILLFFKKFSMVDSQWTSVKSFDGDSLLHKSFNRIEKQWIETPHVHDPLCFGLVREPEDWEIPK